MVGTCARRLLVWMVACAAAGLARGVAAGPEDPQPGWVLATISPTGTALRGTPQWTGTVLARLPARTAVTVEEVLDRGWIRVTARVDGRTVRGWLRKTAVADPAGVPVAPTPVGPGPEISEHDVSALSGKGSPPPGRSRDYRPVDAMEVSSHAVDPDEVEAFVRAGAIAGGDRVRRSPLSDPTLAERSPPAGGSDAEERTARLLGGLHERLGLGERTGDVADGALEGMLGYFEAMKRAFDPTQEYFLGRAVAADAIARLGIDPDLGRRDYVQLLGQALVRTTQRVAPTLGGYHFDVLDSDEVDGFSGAGGHVLLTRGAVLRCRNEDDLAALLAHEIAHVQLKHAERRVRRRGEIVALADGAARTLRAASDPRESLDRLFDRIVARLDADPRFEDDLEHEADVAGSYLLAELGFDFWALRDLLRSLAGRNERYPARSDASPQVRASRLEEVLRRTYGAYAHPAWKNVRETRFRERLRALPPPAIRDR